MSMQWEGGNNTYIPDSMWWWGYKHVNGDIIAKRWYGDREIEEAKESDFVWAVHGPFKAKDLIDATKILREHYE